MDRYSKIDRSILTDAKFNRLSKEGKLLFLTLLIHPHLTVLGAMRATLSGLAREMQWPEQDFHPAFTEILQKGMIKYDEDACLLWLPKYLHHHRPKSYKVIKSWEHCLDFFPECVLKREIIDQAKIYIAELPARFSQSIPEVFKKSNQVAEIA